MTKASQSICAHMSVNFDWVIDVINFNCISIQNVLLRKNIYNEHLRIQSGFWTYVINKEHV